MHVFLIDTENVSFHGFKGIGQLNSTDIVYVLYSEKFYNSKPDGELFMESAASKASLIEEKLEPKGKNYLDMQLSTIVGKVMERYNSAEIVIISKDRDYEAVIDYWKKHDRKITMAETIDLYFHPSKEPVAKKVSEPKKAGSKKVEEKNQPVKDPKTVDGLVMESYRLKVVEILEELLPDKSKASITKYSKSVAKKTNKKSLKSYCITTFGDSQKNSFKVYARICQVFPY